MLPKSLPGRIGAAICASALLASAIQVHAVSSNPDRTGKARVLVLGTYHFANPGADVMNTDAGDILSDERQKEVMAVVDALAAFEPTRIMVESRDQAETDSEYEAYVAGERELTANETEQLGYRLARRLGHEKVYAVDKPGTFEFGTVMEYARENDPEFLKSFGAFRERFENHYQTLPRRHSVREALRIMNEPGTLDELNSLYPRIAQVGAGDNWVGADLVTDWHERNIRIFATIARNTEPGDRVLVIFGSGHKPTLDYFIDYAADMELVEPVEYLR